MQTYHPTRIGTDDASVPASLKSEIENIAAAVHDQWAARRMHEGWVHGARIDSDAKTHSSLVPYPQLPESEKELDRATAVAVVAALVRLGYSIQKG